MRHRVVLTVNRALRIGRVTLSLVAAGGLALVACSHPGGRGGPVTGNAGTTGTGGDISPAGSAGTGSGAAGTTGAGGDVGPGAAGTSGNAGTTGSAGNSGPGAAGTTGAAGNSGPGAAGTTGAAGNGASGTTGNAGTSGAAGTTGAGGSGSGTNLIANGDLSSGATNWHTEGGTGNVNNGAYCVGSPSSATLVGWDAPAGMPLMLMSGTPYRISYQASGAGTVHLKVGQAASPFNAIHESDHGISSSPQTFTDNFTPTASNNAGLAFYFMNAGTSTVCIDNVTLVAN